MLRWEGRREKTWKVARCAATSPCALRRAFDHPFADDCPQAVLFGEFVPGVSWSVCELGRHKLQIPFRAGEVALDIANSGVQHLAKTGARSQLADQSSAGLAAHHVVAVAVPTERSQGEHIQRDVHVELPSELKFPWDNWMLMGC
ncbi:MAG TPA: hypothetical protein VFV87_17765, partial [Pirellulaceae bacterium]|nr:hypothetical protein [Pirellulaceae bacterium]